MLLQVYGILLFVSGIQISHVDMTGWDNWLGVPMNESFRAQTWGYIKSDESIGAGPFDKALYKAYTDATFTEQVEQPDWAGYQGPILRAEVGDMIEVGYIPFAVVAGTSYANHRFLDHVHKQDGKLLRDHPFHGPVLPEAI
jgi:hypothetical protein